MNGNSFISNGNINLSTSMAGINGANSSFLTKGNNPGLLPNGNNLGIEALNNVNNNLIEKNTDILESYKEEVNDKFKFCNSRLIYTKKNMVYLNIQYIHSFQIIYSYKKFKN
jgi:hypothetical protein